MQQIKIGIEIIIRLYNLKDYLLIGLRLCICDLCLKDFETFRLAILNIKKENYILIVILVEILQGQFFP